LELDGIVLFFSLSPRPGLTKIVPIKLVRLRPTKSSGLPLLPMPTKLDLATLLSLLVILLSPTKNDQTTRLSDLSLGKST
jgi:hypothetical protein